MDESLPRRARSQVLSDELAALVTHCRALLRSEAVDLPFDGEQRIDAFDRLDRGV
jgi:hypothetical protein